MKTLGHLRQLFIPLVLLLCILPISCGNEDELPEGIIEKEKFIEILSDVQIFESMNQYIRNKETDFDIDHTYQWMFEHYNVTEEEFKSSLDYYSQDPLVFEVIYDEVIVRISEKQVEFTKKTEP